MGISSLYMMRDTRELRLIYSLLLTHTLIQVGSKL